MEFPIIPEKTAMLFFDTLNGYMHPTDPERAAKVAEAGTLPKMMEMEKACREAGIAIFYGQADHRQDGKDAQAMVVGDPPHLTTTGGSANYSGSWYAQVVDELEPRPLDYVIKKHRWSTFHQTHLELSLRSAGIDTITGRRLHGCRHRQHGLCGAGPGFQPDHPARRLQLE